MPIRPDWQRRVDNHIAALKRRTITRLAPVPMEFSSTFDHLTPEQARKLPFAPCPAGTEWGSKWQYAWFRGTAKLNGQGKGKRIELLYDNADSVTWINGEIRGEFDSQHKTVLLAEKASGSETFDILLETYAWHGDTPCNFGLLLPGEHSVPEPPVRQQKFRECSIVVFNEETYQLLMDFLTLASAAAVMDENSMVRGRMESALQEATCVLDAEAEDSVFESSVKKARELIAPVLALKNGSASPEMYCFGHAHIDVAWLWPLAETKRKAARTFSTQLNLMKQYPEHKFLQSQPQLYDYIKTHYPDIYAGVKQAVKSGRWIADGGLWVECDTNLSGGESIIRQFLYGKRFFREEFGVENRLMWLPDVFGYSGALPQIMKGCGIDYFSTQKIYWVIHWGAGFPFDTFRWEGIDGTEVLSHIHRDYNAETKPAWLANRWKLCNQKQETEIMLLPFGWGDGGGGPTRDHLEYLRRCRDLQEIPKTRLASPTEFFKEFEKRGLPEARYKGELYFEGHRGTYTTQAKTKKGNRKSEFSLREAELWSSAGLVLSGKEYPAERIEKNWKKVLLNQFHDIIPGSSIARVYEEANKLYDEVRADASVITADAARSMLDHPEGAAFTVWNSLSWSRDIVVEVEAGGDLGSAATQDGTACVTQTAKPGKMLVKIPAVPGLAAKSFTLSRGTPGPAAVPEKLKLENEHLRAQFNEAGEIVSLVDKRRNRELVKPGSVLNEFLMFRDQPGDWDAWDIDLIYRKNPVELSRKAGIRTVYSGPVETRLVVERQLEKSRLTQEIVLRQGEARLDFETVIDWQESRKLLKTAFPLDIRTDFGRWEIQFGHIKRPITQNTDEERSRFEVSGHKFMDLSENDYGVSILNDCKYGWDCLDGIPKLTLLRAPIAPDETADRGSHAFSYSLFLHEGPFGVKTVREGYELNVPLVLTKGALKSTAGKPLFSVDADNIIIETVKRSEDAKSIVVRLYESAGQATVCVLKASFPFRKVRECDLVEENDKEISASADGVKVEFHTFGIRTFKFVL